MNFRSLQLSMLANDEQDKRERLKRQKEDVQRDKDHKALNRFRETAREQLLDMKHQEKLVEQMKLFNKAGNYEEAAKIKARIEPKKNRQGGGGGGQEGEKPKGNPAKYTNRD